MNLYRIAAALWLCAATLAHADEPGADHPGFARYPGAVMKHFDFREYEEGAVVLSTPMYQGNAMTAKTQPVEGRVTYLHYENPPNASALQVFRNHQSALKRAGYTELFTCNRPCGTNNLGNWGPLLKSRGLYLNGGPDDLFYTAQQQGNTYVSLAVNAWSGQSHTWVFVIDKGALDDQRIAVTGNSPIAQALSQNGRVDIYGFKFDTGQTALKPESAATLRELGQVLKDNPTLQIDVIGHTDDVGSPEANQALSEGRAQAVAAALTAEQQVAADRLFPVGRGMTQRIADNGTAEGRAKNRRVEIALRGGTQMPTQARAPVPAPGKTQTSAPAPAPAPQPQPAKDTTLDTANQLMDAASKLKGLFGR